MTYSITNNIKGILLSVTGATADAMETRFFNNNGSIILVNDTKSNYVHSGVENGLVKYGTIYVGTKAIDNLAATAQLTPNQAAKAIAVHELGHAAYQQRAYQSQPGDNATMDAKVEWCLQREGMATFYAFKVAQESGWAFVAGTTATPNLYDTMLSALDGIAPRSTSYETTGFAVATAAFKADYKYVAFCKNPDNWVRPSYVSPEPPLSGGGGGTISGGGGSFSYVPEPGGYWQEVPPPLSSDSVEMPSDSLDSLIPMPMPEESAFQVSDDEAVHGAYIEIATLIGQSHDTGIYF